MNWKFAAIAIICVLIGFIVGSQMQQYKELNWCVKTGLFFLKEKGIEIEINEGAMTYAVGLYKGQIDRLIKTNLSSSGG